VIGDQEKGRGISSDPEEGDLTEGKHPGISSHDIPGHCHHSKHKNQDHDMLGERLREG
jgi:hypothetical protein